MNVYFLQSFIQSTVKIKSTSSSGWRSCNAPCCIYNNETKDTRGRGGFLFEADGGTIFHCFNCSYSTNWLPGRPLSTRFKNLLKWFGTPQDKIEVLQFEALDLKVNGDYESEFRFTNALPIEFPLGELPPKSKLFSKLANESISDNNFIDVLTYGYDRNINLQKYDLMWTPNTEKGFNRKIIVPFYYKEKLVGYSARSIDEKKFNNQMPAGYVYNIDSQKDRRRKNVIVCEGLFDAMTIDSVAVLHNRIGSIQAGLIESLNRDIIVVPDFDYSGVSLMNDALENGWPVSFPVWANDFKDINDAVKELGKIFVLENIFSSVITNPIKIQLLAKKFMKKGNKK